MLVSIVQLFELPVVSSELELLSFFEQEMMVTLKNIDRERNKIFFIFSSIPSKILLCVLGTLLIPQFRRFYKNVEILLGWCLDCEELVGVFSGDDGVGFRNNNLLNPR